MKLLLSVTTLLTAARARSIHPQPVLHNTNNDDEASRIPTIHESTIMARRILHLSSIGTLVTTFPELSNTLTNDDDDVTTQENRPEEMAGSPIGLMEYYADCEPDTGNPTLLAINIATPFRNHAAGSNISLHVRWWPEQKNSYFAREDDDDEIPTPHTPAALPRFSLHGRLEPIPAPDLLTGLIPACFMRAHQDSVLWQPGNDIHTSSYVRFIVDHVYWFGGFGDRAQIGWLPIEEWRNVTMDEVQAARLPGEGKGRGEEDSWFEWVAGVIGARRKGGEGGESREAEHRYL